jgi:hypothetical protein
VSELYAFTTTPVVPRCRAPYDDPVEREAVAWFSLCEAVYRAGLRLVPPTEPGGTLPVWTVDGDRWSTTAVVEPVENRPAHYVTHEPWHRVATRMLARGDQVDTVADTFGVTRDTISRLRGAL